MIGKHAPTLGQPSPDMLTRHLNSKEPLPEWVTQLKTHYLTAMSEFYRANTRAREGSRTLTLYYAKKLEFAFHFASCLENLSKPTKPAPSPSMPQSSPSTTPSIPSPMPRETPVIAARLRC
ncbi:MAG: hypothetical protein IPK32_26130 [Verrucomicrobiaceae bacterium]|nr:hypothetical protein [Verrucomicrobiaceae bacterium]